jgi:2-polyprenyl-6-methoxyphenol hydroxylase-like FAD-dependent oxidoreductase
MILIVGGGIGGLSLAACLARRGIACELVERQPGWTTVGGGITLYPNGMRALRAVGASAAVEAGGVALDRYRILARDGRLLSEQPGESWGGVGRTFLVDRRVLQGALLGAVGDVPVRLGVTVSRLTLGRQRAVVAFTDGTAGEYDLVVGADGIRSRVRRLAFGDVAPRYVGQMYWRASTEADLVDCPTMMFDQDRYVVVFPVGGGRTYLAWQLRTERPMEGRAAGSLGARFADFAEPCGAAIECVRDRAGVHFGPAEEIASERWSAGNAVLIGDAAHACSPTMAQGGAWPSRTPPSSPRSSRARPTSRRRSTRSSPGGCRGCAGCASARTWRSRRSTRVRSTSRTGRVPRATSSGRPPDLEWCGGSR